MLTICLFGSYMDMIVNQNKSLFYCWIQLCLNWHFDFEQVLECESTIYAMNVTHAFVIQVWKWTS